MVRYVKASAEVDSESGFLFEFGNKAIFLKSNQQKITDKLLRKIINAVCDIKNVGDSIRHSALYDEATLKDFRRRTDKATLTQKTSDNFTYYSIEGKNFTLNFPEGDFEESVIVID